MSFRRLFLATALLISVGSAPVVAESVPNLRAEQFTAQNQHHSFPANKDNHRGGKTDRLIEQLDLNSEQQETLQEIRSRYQPQMQSKREALRTAHEELRDLFSSNASRSALQSQHRQMLELRQDLAELRFESMLEMREVLTSQQRQELTRLMEQRHQHHRNRGQQRRSQQ